jgi:sensor c-di-GMP phosphodiesterase-like protein
VRELPNKDESLAIVRAIIRLADSLGMTTLAEGVETTRQFAILRHEGCVEAQGDLFSRPVSGDQVMQLHESIRSLLTGRVSFTRAGRLGRASGRARFSKSLQVSRAS